MTEYTILLKYLQNELEIFKKNNYDFNVNDKFLFLEETLILDVREKDRVNASNIFSNFLNYALNREIHIRMV